jgi:hypothetical protein
MSDEEIEEFEGGVDKFREHINKLVARVNELTKELQGVLDWPVHTAVIHNAENTRLQKVEIKSCVVVEDVGEIDCDCVSGQSHGAA